MYANRRGRPAGRKLEDAAAAPTGTPLRAACGATGAQQRQHVCAALLDGVMAHAVEEDDIGLREGGGEAPAVARPHDAVVRSPDSGDRGGEGGRGPRAAGRDKRRAFAWRAAVIADAVRATWCRARDRRTSRLPHRADSRHGHGLGQRDPAEAGGREEHQRGHPRREQLGQPGGNRAAEGVAHQLEALEAERVDPGGDVRGVCGDVGRARKVGAAEAGQVEGDARAVEVVADLGPDFRRGEDPVQEDHRARPLRARRAPAACARPAVRSGGCGGFWT